MSKLFSFLKSKKNKDSDFKKVHNISDVSIEGDVIVDNLYGSKVNSKGKHKYEHIPRASGLYETPRYQPHHIGWMNETYVVNGDSEHPYSELYTKKDIKGGRRTRGGRKSYRKTRRGRR